MTAVGHVFERVVESGYKLSWLLMKENDTDSIVPSLDNPNHRIGWVTDVENWAGTKKHLYCKLNILQLNGDDVSCHVQRLRATSLMFQKLSPVRIGVFLSRERNTQTVWELESAVVFVDTAAVDKLMRGGKTVFNTLLASTIFMHFITQSQCVFTQTPFWKKQMFSVCSLNVENDKRFRRRFGAGNKTSYSLRNNIIRLTKHTAVDIERGVPVPFRNINTTSRPLRTGVLLNVRKSFDFKGFVQVVLKTCKDIDTKAFNLLGVSETVLIIVPKLGIADYIKILEDMNTELSIVVLQTAEDVFRTTAQSLRAKQTVVLVTYELLCSRQYTNYVKLAVCTVLQTQLRSNRINKNRWLMNQMMNCTGPEMSTALRLQNILSDDWGAPVTLASARRMFLPENTFNTGLCVPLELLTFGAIVMTDVQHCFAHTQFKGLCETLGNLDAVHRWATLASDNLQGSAQEFLWAVLLRRHDVPRSQACIVLKQVALETLTDSAASLEAAITRHDCMRVPVWDMLDWEDFNVTSDTARSFYLQFDIPNHVCIGKTEQLVKQTVFEQELQLIRQCFKAAKRTCTGSASVRLGSGQIMQTARWSASMGPVYSAPVVTGWLDQALEGLGGEGATRTITGVVDIPVFASQSEFDFLTRELNRHTESDDEDDDYLADFQQFWIANGPQQDEQAQDATEGKSTDGSGEEIKMSDTKDTEESDESVTTTVIPSTLPDAVKTKHIRQQISAVKRNRDAWNSLSNCSPIIPTCPVCVCEPCKVMLKCGHVFCYACASMSVEARKFCPTCQCKVVGKGLMLILDQPHVVNAPSWLPENLHSKWIERVCSSAVSNMHWTSAQFWMWYHLNTPLSCVVIVNSDKDIGIIAKLSRGMNADLPKPVRRLTPFALVQFQENKAHLILSKRLLMSGACPSAHIVLVLCALNDVENSILKAAVPGATMCHCVYSIEDVE